MADDTLSVELTRAEIGAALDELPVPEERDCGLSESFDAHLRALRSTIGKLHAALDAADTQEPERIDNAPRDPLAEPAVVTEAFIGGPQVVPAREPEQGKRYPGYSQCSVHGHKARFCIRCIHDVEDGIGITVPARPSQSEERLREAAARVLGAWDTPRREEPLYKALAELRAALGSSGCREEGAGHG
jgi:hypothetical protein